MARTVALVLFGLVAVSALPFDPVVRNLAGDGPRFQYIHDGNGNAHLADLWVKASDLKESGRFNPDRQNVYHLFTRPNPDVSQPLLRGADGLVGPTNYNSTRRTVVTIHGWMNNATSDVNTVLVPAFLAAEDVNVIVVDWGAGADTINYPAAVINTVTSGVSVANFIAWLNNATGSDPSQYHIAGHSLGGHQSGIVGRNLGNQVTYITAMDPALPGWGLNDNKFRKTDGIYTEIIHTNAGALGYPGALGDVDFYPNGGSIQPRSSADHSRSYFYMAESVRSGGFTGRECDSVSNAAIGNCNLPGTLQMGGITPKIGSTGIFYLTTNAVPPFSKG